MPERPTTGNWLIPLALACLAAFPAPGQDVIEILPAEIEAPPAVAEKTEAAKTTPEEQADEKPDAKAEKSIEEQVAELNAEIQKKQAELQQAERELRDRQRKERDSQPIPGIEEVRAATLPDNPTRQQCADYIDKLREATANRNRRSSSDLCVEKLKAVPKEHVDLLIDEYSSQSSLSWYVIYALRDDHNEAIRKRVTETVNMYPNNINLVIAHGWCEEARPAIRKALEGGELPGRNWQENGWWFQAAVELQDPDLYPKLHEITVKSDQWESYIEMLAILPDYDLAHTINTCIARQTKDDGRQQHMIMHGGHFRSIGSGGMTAETAKLAAELGNIEGLAVLVNAIPSPGSYVLQSNWNAAEPRMKVLRFIRFRGSNDEIKQWFEENRGKLAFDHLNKQFVLPESGDADAAQEQDTAHDEQDDHDHASAHEPAAQIRDAAEAVREAAE